MFFFVHDVLRGQLMRLAVPGGGDVAQPSVSFVRSGNTTILVRLLLCQQQPQLQFRLATRQRTTCTQHGQTSNNHHNRQQPIKTIRKRNEKKRENDEAEAPKTKVPETL
eukprot:INCI5254.2.p1 GENE.INCI5254.2~~INCI5254.2.p1  ORF type:complete len:109 (-),score=21.45 INCI5254.2:169-495(-)